MIPLAISQVRADPDPRAKGRTVTILSVNARYAYVLSNRGAKSRILATTLERWPVTPTQQEPA
jgi:hypothetical protein